MASYRALFHFHHLLSAKKRAAIRALAADLRVHSLCKTGHPGLLVLLCTPACGSADASAADRVAAFVRAVKAMRWQTCSLRSAEPFAGDGPIPVDLYVEVDRTSAVHDHVRVYGADCAAWFDAAMGYRSGGPEAGSAPGLTRGRSRRR
ncbi:uncharacterized protein V1510DRAFT_163011 [Dipodascopsis tothii]|uniref:uncharacterized protein n=1 Tax=Dipodascopsis tothii TaxID=44089 RepID=UPI0034CF7774